jgi:signal transduction histidine kinase
VKVDHASGPRFVQLHTTPIGPTGQEAVVICATDVTFEKRADEDRKKFMMLASHQLRTPLTPIIAYADLLSKGELTAEEISTAAREILQAGLEMQRLSRSGWSWTRSVAITEGFWTGSKWKATRR